MQQTKRINPFFSGLGCGAVLLLVIVLGAILAFKGGGPFSPGALTAVSQPMQPTTAAAGKFRSHAEFEQDCAQCHAPWRGITAERCETCHDNVATQRTTNAGLHGKLTDSGRCQTCHTDHKGSAANIISLAANSMDHERLTNFSLVHHQDRYDDTPLVCEDCHSEGLRQLARTDCLTCHQTAAAPFMAEHITLFGADCLACHDGRDAMADFDHAQVFALDGAHATVACQDCHANQVFQGAPNECAACHAEPEVHAGLFGLDCVRCHTTTAWVPAQLTQHIFPLDHGGEGVIACETCHQQTYTEYTCYNCHAHDPAKTRQEHMEEGIDNFENCVECHATGLKKEGEFEHEDN